MRNLPFHDFALNEVWLELSLIGQDLLAWSGVLLLGGALAEPKRLRQRLLHVAGPPPAASREEVAETATVLLDLVQAGGVYRQADQPQVLDAPLSRRSRPSPHGRRRCRRS